MDRLASTFDLFPRLPGVYMVGGSIRDLLLDRSPSDYDLVVLGDPRWYAEDLADQFKGHMVALGKPRNRIYRVVTEKIVVDVSAASGNSIENDLKYRDFTINALAYCLQSKELIDITGGCRDLETGTIRMVSESVFAADPVRLIRAYRIGAQLGFDIEIRTASAIGRQVKEIKKSAGERVCYELLRMLQSAMSGQYLQQMSNTGLLFEIFPEIVALKGCLQNRHHTHDVYGHTFKAYHCLEAMLNEPESAFGPSARLLKRYLALHRRTLLKLSLLFHDIGKPMTRSPKGRGEIHFYGHEQKGAVMADAICRRLRMSGRETNYIRFIIHHHLRPLVLFRSWSAGTLTRRETTRFFIKCGDLAPDLLIHGMADTAGKGNPGDDRVPDFSKFAKQMLASFFQHFQPASSLPPLITGHDLIAEFGLTPSPLFRKILDRVKENRLSGNIKDRTGALKLAADCIERMEGRPFSGDPGCH